MRGESLRLAGGGGSEPPSEERRGAEGSVGRHASRRRDGVTVTDPLRSISGHAATCSSDGGHRNVRGTSSSPAIAFCTARPGTLP